MELGLNGRNVWITGAGRGIGAAIAQTLAAEGACVVVADIDASAAASTAEKIRERGHQAIDVVGDVCNADSVQSMHAAAVDRLGPIDVLVNNAGFARDGYLTRMAEADWDAVVDTALKGAFHCSRAVLPAMMHQRRGRIVNIASRSIFGNPGQTNYAAAKAGLVGFTRALSLEQARNGITVNAVAPGFVETEGMRALPHYEKLRDLGLQKIPVGFLGLPQDIADSVAFLASDRARYISGTTVFVTGGRYSS